MRWSLAVALLAAAYGCGEGDEVKVAVAEPPLALAGPVEIRVRQRSTTALPGSEGDLLLTVDDITRGQVMTSVAWGDGRVVVPTRSLREGGRVRFEIQGFGYHLELVRLANALVGEDFATFRLGALRALGEDEKIEALIVALGRLEGAVFIRNGAEHDASEAVEHLRRKWAWKKAAITSARDFIAVAASGSSTSGDPYRVRLADGSEVTSEAWFLGELARIEEGLDRPNEGATK